MTAYWLLFAATITALAFTWRREVIRDRARARDKARHPSNQSTPGLMVFDGDTFAGLTHAELMACIRARAEADRAGLHDRELTVADVLRGDR